MCTLQEVGAVRTVSVREARQRLPALLNQAHAGEEIAVLRRGVEVARLVPPPRRASRLPDLAEFRASVRVRGQPLSAEVVAGRKGARY